MTDHERLIAAYKAAGWTTEVVEGPAVRLQRPEAPWADDTYVLTDPAHPMYPGRMENKAQALAYQVAVGRRAQQVLDAIGDKGAKPCPAKVETWEEARDAILGDPALTERGEEADR